LFPGKASAVIVQSFRQTSDRKQDSMQKSLWPGWTTRNVNIHRKNLVDACNRRVVRAKDAAANTASAYRDHYLGFRHRPMRLQQRKFHVARDRTGDQEHVGMTRRGNELDSEAFDVVNRIVQCNDLQFATVA